ncbi:unnamed protein product [Arabidopsis thaliana]|uniref:Uncharacterized protein n=4 Tax=Arabidopsis TaxID=3701 RepID=B3H4C6_ARATH|nr:uncharacterized protein AT3G10439 [Arabidopsis thaliana]AEE74906.1 hypothetical protein AT3G10439 [Arabidopsis thaliana]KAG7624711.1 hypothetical protein ISN45_At03g010110 [Arabidopsis thaliana x Arabidopsis arenosa]KAG7630727.1 hypothetical protein ISN44_As03g010210 [Arabidopsis suecica]VYS56900.1 unnamed protein product [Arabidopsis thaliana]|eukprot:NP_001118610.1 hypothetical protein AT3G10439 [Arabidopsis thaliana]
MRVRVTNDYTYEFGLHLVRLKRCRFACSVLLK